MRPMMIGCEVCNTPEGMTTKTETVQILQVWSELNQTWLDNTIMHVIKSGPALEEYIDYLNQHPKRVRVIEREIITLDKVIYPNE